MTFTEMKNVIRLDLQDEGITFYTQQDLDDSVQDAFDEIASISQCFVNKVILPFQDNLTYYNFRDLANFPNIFVRDYLTTLAVFNNNTNLWLLDDKVTKDFDLDRLDWENWTGQPVWWAPCNDFNRIAIVPKLPDAVGTFDFYYVATAPTVQNDNEIQLPPDFQNLIEFYSVADLLEQAEEYSKAAEYWEDFWGIEAGQQNFDKGIWLFAERSRALARADLLMLA